MNVGRSRSSSPSSCSELLGAATAYGISSALGIRVEPKDVPVEALRAAPPRESVAPPRVRVDGTRRRTPGRRRGPSCATRPPTAQGTATLRVRFGDGDPDDDSYRLTGDRRPAADPRGQRDRGGSRHLRPRARPPAAAARSPSASARRSPPGCRSGWSTSAPRASTPTRRSGAAAPTTRTTPGRSRTSCSPEAPWSTRRPSPTPARSSTPSSSTRSRRATTPSPCPGSSSTSPSPRCRRSTPSTRGDRTSPGRGGAGGVRPAVGRAHELGLEVYLRTDMLALSTPLERHLTERFDLDPTTPALGRLRGGARRALRASCRSCRRVSCSASARAGRSTTLPGMDYFSEITVTTAPAVRAMLDAFTGQAERADKDVVFRTWSVGVGAVGDMHTNPESYDEVLAGVDSPRLVVSTKYSLGDFYSLAPAQRDARAGQPAAHRRAAEPARVRVVRRGPQRPRRAPPARAAPLPRREPARRGRLDVDPGRRPVARRAEIAAADHRLLAALRPQHRGRRPAGARPGRRPRRAHRRLGAALALHRPRHGRDGHRGHRSLARGGHPRAVHRPQFAEVRAFALGLEPPPQMCSSSGTSSPATARSSTSSTPSPATRAGRGDGGDRRRAARDRRRHDHARPRRRHRRRRPTATRRCASSCSPRSTTRSTCTPCSAPTARWCCATRSGSTPARAATSWESARQRFDAAAVRHEETYGDDLALPAYNLTAARIGEERAARDLPMAWLARGGLLALLLGLGLTRTGRTLVRAAVTPWRDPGPVSRWLVVALPVAAVAWSRLVLTWFLAPATCSPSASAGACSARSSPSRRGAPARGTSRPRSAARWSSASLLLLAVLAWRGPGGYWFVFWTEPLVRTAYVVVAVVLAGWVLAAPGVVAGRPVRQPAGRGDGGRHRRGRDARAGRPCWQRSASRTR